jgi:hypothetical protein
MAKVKSARKLRSKAGTGFAAIKVISLEFEVVQTKDSTRENRRIFKVRESYCVRSLRIAVVAAPVDWSAR